MAFRSEFFKSIELAVWANNPAAIRVYQNAGFSAETTVSGGYWDLDFKVFQREMRLLLEDWEIKNAGQGSNG
ncbi:MAG: hypothetical protein AAF217_14195 [Pseudomonadota bacterium]